MTFSTQSGIEIGVWVCIVWIALLVLFRHRARYLLIYYTFTWLVLALHHTDPADTEKGDGSVGYHLGYSALMMQTSLVLLIQHGLIEKSLLTPTFFLKCALLLFSAIIVVNITFLFTIDPTRIGVAVIFLLLFLQTTISSLHRPGALWSILTCVFFMAAQVLEIVHASAPAQMWEADPWLIHYVVWFLLCVANVCTLMHQRVFSYVTLDKHDDPIEVDEDDEEVGLQLKEVQFVNEISRQFNLVVPKTTVQSQCQELRQNLLQLTELRTRLPPLDTPSDIQLVITTQSTQEFPFPSHRRTVDEWDEFKLMWSMKTTPALQQPFSASKLWNVPFSPLEFFMMLSEYPISARNNEDCQLLRLLESWDESDTKNQFMQILNTLNATQLRRYVTNLHGFRRIYFGHGCPFLLDVQWDECLEYAQMLLIQHERLHMTWFEGQHLLLSTNPLLDSKHNGCSKKEILSFLDMCLQTLLIPKEVDAIRHTHAKCIQFVSLCHSTLGQWNKHTKALGFDVDNKDFTPFLVALSADTSKEAVDCLSHELKHCSFSDIAKKMQEFINHCAPLRAAFEHITFTHVLGPAQHTALAPLLQWTQEKGVRPESIFTILRLCLLGLQSVMQARDWVEVNCFLNLALQDQAQELMKDVLEVLETRREFFNDRYFCFEHTIEHVLFSASALHRQGPPPTLSGIGMARQKGIAIQFLQQAWAVCRVGRPPSQLYQVVRECVGRSDVDVTDLKQRLISIVEDHFLSHPALPPPSNFLVSEAIQCWDHQTQLETVDASLYVLTIWAMALFSGLEGQCAPSSFMAYYYDDRAFQTVIALEKEFWSKKATQKLNPVSQKMEPCIQVSPAQRRAQLARKQFNSPLYVKNPWKL